MRLGFGVLELGVWVLKLKVRLVIQSRTWGIGLMMQRL